MIQDETTEWPTFESILREVREQHASERAAREAADTAAAAERAAQEAATADLLVAERPVSDQTESGSDIFVDELAVEESVAHEPVVHEPVVEDTDIHEDIAIHADIAIHEDAATAYDVPESTVDSAAGASLFPNELLDSEQDSLDFVPQDEPVIETTSAEFIATPPTITDSPSFFNQVASDPSVDEDHATIDSGVAEHVPQAAVIEEATVGSEPTDSSLNPFDPAFEGIAEDVVDDDDEWVSHSLTGVVPTQVHTPIVDSDAPPLAEDVAPADDLAPLTPFEHPLDIGAVDDASTPEDSYDGDDVWDLDQEEVGGVVIPLHKPEPPSPDLQLVGLDQDLPDVDPEPSTASQPAANTFALRPNVFTSGETPQDTVEQDEHATEAYTPEVEIPPPVGAIPVADPTTAPTPGVKPEDPWSTMRPRSEPEKITFWENRPKFFGGDERRRAKAQREAAKAAEAQDADSSGVAQARNCPNCGSLCRVDVHDKALNRLHLSCNSCRHMWVEDGE